MLVMARFKLLMSSVVHVPANFPKFADELATKSSILADASDNSLLIPTNPIHFGVVVLSSPLKKKLI